MDVNNTRFHLVLHRDRWLGHKWSGLDFDTRRRAITLAPELFRFPPPAETTPLDPANRKGAARDPYGNWYWIAEDNGEIRILPNNAAQSLHFWNPGDTASSCEKEPGEQTFRPEPLPRPRSLRLKAMAATPDHFLVVGVIEPAGLLVFDLHSGGAPNHILWPQEEQFQPFDIAADPGGGVWVLDSENRKCWKLDRFFRLDPVHSFGLEASRAVAVEPGPDRSVFILDGDPALLYDIVYHCTFDDPEEPFICRSYSLENTFTPGSPFSPPESGTFKAYDMAYAETENTLYIADTAGNQAFAFSLEESSLTLQPIYFPMRLFSGKGLVAAGGVVYYDQEERWLPLTHMPRCRYHTSGWTIPPPFDGKEPRCVWHRLFIDAYIPPGTALVVESIAVDDPDDLPGQDDERWTEESQEPRPYLRAAGAELPYYQPFLPDEHPLDGAGTWELLFQKAKGRYLHLRLTLTGGGAQTPVLFAMRVYYPRFSYLKEYLPALYREDPGSASFMDRFLANFEGMYTVLEGRIAEVRVLFDVDITNPEYLDWLAGWFGVLLDPAWDEDRRRLFLRHAPELFKQRGTPAGIIRAVRLAIDPCPNDSLFEEDVSGHLYQKAAGYRIRIIEGFLTRHRPAVIYGDPTAVTGPAIIPEEQPWRPEHGAELLNQRYRRYLETQYDNSIHALNDAWGGTEPYPDFAHIYISPTDPTDKNELADWRRFLETELDFSYPSLSPSDEYVQKTFREFMEWKYRRVECFNTGYGTDYSSFDQVELPQGEIPSGALQLGDWIQFVSGVLPARRHAHFFTVLVPVGPHMEARDIRRRLDWVERIVEFEKPAHTNFQVKPYWALFQVGTARLGLDTVPGMGSRFTAMLLGKDALAEGYLQAAYPWHTRDRWVVGGDPVKPGKACDLFSNYIDKEISS
jgi:phage tail-like protein